MSEKTTPVKANERPKYGPAHRGGGPGGGHGMGGSGEKAANFGVSLKRLLSNLRPERIALIIAVTDMVRPIIPRTWVAFRGAEYDSRLHRRGRYRPESPKQGCMWRRNGQRFQRHA